MQRAGGMDAVEDVDHVPRRHTEGIQTRHDIRQRTRAGDLGDLRVAALLDAGIGPRNHHGFAAGEGVGLRDHRGFLDPERQAALADGNAGDPDVLADHDRTRALVDHHPRLLFGLDPDILDPADDMGGIRGAGLADVDRHGAGIRHLRDPPLELAVDRGLDPRGRGEIGGFQREAKLAQAVELEGDLAFDARPRGDGARGRHAARHRRGLARRRDPAGDDGALGDGVNLAVCRLQRCHHQRAAEQAFRVADRRDRHVDLAARSREGREGGSHQNGSDVLRPELLAGHVDPQTFEDVRHDLFGEGGVAEPVAGAVEPDDQPVADEIVAAHAIDFDQILDPDRGRLHGKRQEQQDDQGEKAHHR
ncbi:hypothetical protein SDC9_06471 [bioreactor metagenome]|uniref:Uncharacterized protein n=1 Tax=bioreactor metagenome TaxID=1076179 RepID=A0A644T1Y0_9ZZZZ